MEVLSASGALSPPGSAQGEVGKGWGALCQLEPCGQAREGVEVSCALQNGDWRGGRP